MKSAIVTQFESHLRRRRFLLLENLLRPLPRPIRILDVGGTVSFWRTMDHGRLGEIHVTLLNRFAQDDLPPRFRSEVGDARCLDAYRPEDYDVVFSNSVLGHVGTFEDQKRMSNEIKRIARRYFVQTPNRYFVVDWRTLVPFFHFLPIRLRAWCVCHVPIAPFGRLSSYSSAVEWASLVRDLTRREVRILFPDAKLVRERLLGITKSFIAFGGFEKPNESRRDGPSSPPSHEVTRVLRNLVRAGPVRPAPREMEPSVPSRRVSALTAADEARRTRNAAIRALLLTALESIEAAQRRLGEQHLYVLT